MKKLILISLFSLFVVLTACSSSVKSLGTEEVVIIEINEDSMIVKDVNNPNKDQQTIKIPKIITSLISEQNKYHISYEYYKNQTPELVSISPSE
ncbi:hypothetical protein ACXZ7E_09345 [Paenibacillus lautus]